MRFPVVVVLVVLLNVLVCDVSTSSVKGVSQGKGKAHQKDQQIQTRLMPQQPKDPLSEDDVSATTAHTPLDEATPESTGEDDSDSQAEEGQGDSAEDSDGQSSEDSDGQSSEEGNTSEEDAR
ncbi:uncharacterized protein LOC134437951 isoform X2 [Engraulis encrasicolus]|uniref:uncharacterized protein LOC134437951 isoform X2 n=1 Tax=Engraulis encrasicolus TaxID=184585 RepID=UPI002FD607F3